MDLTRTLLPSPETLSMSDVPAETIEILSRLPVKPLLRFRCVSKPWCALIDSPYFIKLHLNQSIESNSNPSIILTSRKPYFIDLDSLDKAIELNHLTKFIRNSRIVGSCNGLFCSCGTNESIVLWNPSTGKYQKLPSTNFEFPVTNFSYPYNWQTMYLGLGFGYDHVNDDYKVVRIVQFYGKDDDLFDSEVRVYSLKLNSWRRIQDFPYYLSDLRVYGVLASGALHWIVNQKPESDGAGLIAAFDLKTGEYRLVPQPDYSDKNFSTSLEVLEGCLCVHCNYNWRRNIDIWVMKDYGVKESWTKLISVTSSYKVAKPLVYSKSGEQVLLEQDNAMLIWYDLNRKTVERVRVGLPYHFYSSVFVGSLVQLNGGDGSDEEKQQAQDQRKKKKVSKRRYDLL